MSYELAIINPRKRRATPKQLAARRRFIARFAHKKARRPSNFRRSKRGRISYTAGDGTRRRLKMRTRRVARRRKTSSIHSGASVMAKRKRRSRRNAKGHFVKRSRKSTAVRRTRRRRSYGSRRPAQGYVVGSGKIRRRKLNPRSRRRRHRNPMSLGGALSVNNILGQLVPAAYGAGGAIALNIGLSYLPLPAVMQTGWGRHVTRLGGAMLVGWAARKFLGARGNAVGFGALTVVVYDILKGLIGTAAPEFGARLGDFEDVSLADDGLVDAASPVRGFAAYLEGGADDEGLAAYLQGNMDGMAGNLDGTGEFSYV